MPNTNISLYLNDSEYILYVEHKEIINKRVREIVKRMLAGEKDDQ